MDSSYNLEVGMFDPFAGPSETPAQQGFGFLSMDALQGMQGELLSIGIESGLVPSDGLWTGLGVGGPWTSTVHFAAKVRR